MACEQFKAINFKSESRDLIDVCVGIVEDYQAQDLKLTLRQLYYQLVSRDIIPNVERSYKNLSTLVTNARLAGLMDWDAIEDRGRQARTTQEFDDLDELVATALNAYRLPRWKYQENYVELWVEKEALAGVLAPIARDYHITLMVNKGYSSASAMYESARRFMRNDEREPHESDQEHRDEFDEEPDLGRQFHLLYLGDHDPSGEDMVRDVRERLNMFGASVSVTKVALTMTQVKKYNPPPNPAKVTDPRAAGYIALFGDKSWEVDALPPQMLNRIIRAELDKLVDVERLNDVVAQENRDKELLKKAVAKLRRSP